MPFMVKDKADFSYEQELRMIACDYTVSVPDKTVWATMPMLSLETINKTTDNDPIMIKVKLPNLIQTVVLAPDSTVEYENE